MYLKKLEACGFKSFANRTVLEFQPGIMGIVGPNGSGKSNVADAIRWVLGEQSARSLRGSNMQDVIFAGTENRKPLGFASVELTIDNRDHVLGSDYDEVKVARRVYRSGESEYLLNGSLCRLRDVQELFYDTGVGQDGYSIIGQGQIDQILSGRPEDRRELFDEAAGIMKYRKRRSITQKKLETEEGNLVRVTDILSELEKRVGPLEKQSEKAKAYLKLREDLKRADLDAYSFESADYTRRLNEAKTNLAVVEEDRKTASEDAEKLRKNYEEYAGKLSDLDHERDELREDLSTRKVRRENLEGEIRILTEQAGAAKTNEENMRARMEKIRVSGEQKREEYRKLEAEKKKLMVEQGALEAETESTAQDVQDGQTEVRRLRDKILQIGQDRVKDMNEMAETAARLERNGTLHEQEEKRQSELENISSEEKTEKVTLEQKIREEKEKLRSLTEKDHELKKTQTEVRKRQSTADQQLRNVNEKLAQSQQRYHQVRSRHDQLLNIAERYEGYGSSVRKIMEMRSRENGILGAVADLFHTEKKYETAIETALGGRIQNIVTDTEATAKRLIASLKASHSGRATFLPLESVHGRTGQVRAEVLQEPGVIGCAVDLVETEDRFRGIAAYLLGRYVVTDDIDAALALARKYHYSLNLVTLGGELLSPGGAITGGSFRNSSNLLGRRREIEELGREAEKLSADLTRGQKQAADLEKSIQTAKEQLDQTTDELHRLDLERNTASLNLDQYSRRMKDQNDVRRAREEEMKAAKSRLRELEAEKSRLETRKQQLNQHIADGEKEEKECRETLSGEEKQLETKNQLSAELHQKASRLEQQAGFITENQNRLLKEREELDRERAALKESMEGGGQLAEEREQKIQSLKKSVEEETAACQNQERKLSQFSEERDRLSQKQKEIFDSREQISGRLSQLDREFYRLQNSAERLSDQIEKLTEYIWDEYEMTPSEAEAAAPHDSGSLTESRRTVSRARKEIRELGAVNVNAIDEYKEVNERYTFLKGQHDDLTKAADSLRGIIRDLEEGMRRQFAENFAKIQAEFSRVFRDLFGGGSGKLILTDAEDILEAGIRIDAQPPGKKLQNMMQLSGGEKALTAIALLFAIQNLKPSPFCLLDEIEAALDEPNVDRYAAYLNRLKGQTQFIVITHRRGTMEMADRLYGITMQEKGVSTLVSVDLTDPSLAD